MGPPWWSQVAPGWFLRCPGERESLEALGCTPTTYLPPTHPVIRAIPILNDNPVTDCLHASRLFSHHDALLGGNSSAISNPFILNPNPIRIFFLSYFQFIFHHIFLFSIPFSFYFNFYHFPFFFSFYQIIFLYLASSSTVDHSEKKMKILLEIILSLKEFW